MKFYCSVCSSTASSSLPRLLIPGVMNLSYLPYGDFDLDLGDLSQIRIGVMFMEVINVDGTSSCSCVVFKLKICVELERLVSSSVILRS